MKLFLTIMTVLFFATEGMAQSPQLFVKKRSDYLVEYLKLKRDTTQIKITPKGFEQIKTNGIKILPLDNMPCLVTSIDSNMPVISGLGGKGYKPVPIPNAGYPDALKVDPVGP